MRGQILNANRIFSIDVFRSITMILMIWVNDFWTLISIPKWLKHALAEEDYLGFSDLSLNTYIFPMELVDQLQYHHHNHILMMFLLIFLLFLQISYHNVYIL